MNEVVIYYVEDRSVFQSTEFTPLDFAHFISLDSTASFVESHRNRIVCCVNFVNIWKVFYFGGIRSYIQTFCLPYIKQSARMCKQEKKYKI
jgi:hypothetical protein